MTNKNKKDITVRCYICDVRLSKDEIQEDPHSPGGFLPCATCLDTSEDTFRSTIEEDTFHTVDVDDFSDEGEVE